MTEWTIDLPVPPSENHRMASRVINGKPVRYPAPAYTKWKRDAGIELAIQRTRAAREGSPLKTIDGPCSATVTINKAKVSALSDVHNRTKALFDFLQDHGLVSNDRNISPVTVDWGVAPLGCRVTVRAAE